MSVETSDHAVLMGYCAGTLALPEGDVCPTCAYDAGLTSGGYVGHHIEEPGPRSIYVDPDDTLTTVDAINTLTPGIFLARPHRCEEDTWQVFHAPTGLIIHPANYFFMRSLATTIACQLGIIGNWLTDADSIRNDPQLGFASQLVCFMAWRSVTTDEAE